MVTNITAASAAFLVPMQAEGKFDPEQLEKAATKKRGGSRAQTNATSGNPDEAGDFPGKMRVVASLLWLIEVEIIFDNANFS